ncbi:MAG: integration host factor [Planctomycetota bacterium]|nr:MAG: integration host factor [Planctomycetota bacterium]
MAKKRSKTTKKPARKATRKKATRRTTKAATRSARITAADGPRTKAQVYREIAENTDLPRAKIAEVFDVLGQMIQKDLGKRGPGVFNVAGLMKVTVQRKPATKARKGVNPFTGEEMMFKAKPARNVVKVRPLKALKDLAPKP